MASWLQRWREGLAAVHGLRQSLRGGPGYQGARSDHFDGERFFNPGASAGPSWKMVLRWLSSRSQKPWPSWREYRIEPQLPTKLAADELAVTFINHMSFLIQLPGLTVMSDPVYSMRASPVRWAGPRRTHAPGVPFEQLPHVDLVFVSHNHYDHLDVLTLKRLAHTHAPLFVTGMGNGLFLREQGIAQVLELDWWQQTQLRGAQLLFTPAQHWSTRGPGTKNRTLWGGLWLTRAERTVYISGDTGYAPWFTELRRRYGRPDVALLPIGCYEPRWFMHEQHMNPDDAVRAHLDLGARTSIGCHFGCFQLTDEGIDEPLSDLEQARQRHGVSAAEFLVPQPGQTLIWSPVGHGLHVQV